MSAVPETLLAKPIEAQPASARSLRMRVFWRGLPWTAPVVVVYVAQLVTSILMGGEWNTALVALQTIVVAVFVAVFYALTLSKERENVELT